MIPKKARQGNPHYKHHQGNAHLVKPSRKDVLENDVLRGLNCFTSHSIEKCQFHQSLRFYFFGKKQITNVRSIEAHNHVVQQKHEKPSIIFFPVRIVCPPTEMVVSGNDSVVFDSIVFASGNFVQLCGLTPGIGLEQEMIVGKMIVPTKGPACDVPRAASVRHRPCEKTRQKHEHTNVGMYVRQAGAFVEQPGVQL
jgi:hypothetical protein